MTRTTKLSKYMALFTQTTLLVGGSLNLHSEENVNDVTQGFLPLF